MTIKTIFVILPHLGGGGAERSTLNLINSWSSLDYNVYLILLKKEGELLKFVDKKINIIDLNCRRISSSLIPSYKLLKKYKPDIILTLMWPLTTVIFFSWILSFKIGKLVLADHNPFNKKWFSEFNINKPLFYISYNISYLLCSAIICVSKNVKQEIEKILFFKKKYIFSINNAVKQLSDDYNIPELKKKLYGNANYCFLSVGRLKKSRDIINLLKALKKFKYLKQSKLIILGVGPEERNLKDYVSKNKLGDHVVFRGFVENTYPFYVSADLYIHTSLYDALPLTIIEALVCNTPILSTDCEYGPSEILEGGKHGLLVPVNDTKELLEGIYKSLNTKINYEIRNNVKKQFDINIISKKYLEIFNLI